MSEDERYVRDVLQRCFAAYEPEDPVMYVTERGLGYVRYGTGETRDYDANKFFVELAPQGAFLYSFSIERRLRGLGLGTQLLHAVDTIACEYGCPSIELAADRDGKWFWPRMGFRETDLGTLVRPTAEQVLKCRVA